MPFYIVRHTTPDVEKGICYGQADLQLVDSFQEEFEAIANKLKSVSIDQTFSSPLIRCKKLANYLSDKEPHFSSDLLEVSFGSWEMKSWEDIGKDNLDQWARDLDNFCPPGGESFLDLKKRVENFFKNKSFSNNDLIITHGGVIKALYVIFNNEKLDDTLKRKISYGDIFVLDQNGLSLFNN